MKAAIDAVPYASARQDRPAIQAPVLGGRRSIYGGISYTDLPIRQIAYPSSDLNRGGRGVLLGAYIFEGANAYEFAALPPADRIARAVDFGGANPSAIPRGVRKRRCRRLASRAVDTWLCRLLDGRGAGAHYDDLCAMDGRILLAGEHASYSSVAGRRHLSSLDAITRLHERVVKT